MEEYILKEIKEKLNIELKEKIYWNGFAAMYQWDSESNGYIRFFENEEAANDFVRWMNRIPKDKIRRRGSVRITGEKWIAILIEMECMDVLSEKVYEESLFNGVMKQEDKKKELLMIYNQVDKAIQEGKKYLKIIPKIQTLEQIIITKDNRYGINLLDYFGCDEAGEDFLKELLNQVAENEGIEKLFPEVEAKTLVDVEEFQFYQEKDYLKEKNDAYNQAFQHYFEEAKNGKASAMHNLAYLYEKGKGVKQDYLEAKYWYEKAIKKGFVKSYNNLAHLYQKGLGVEKDKKRAEKLLCKAIKCGDEKARKNLKQLLNR